MKKIFTNPIFAPAFGFYIVSAILCAAIFIRPVSAAVMSGGDYSMEADVADASGWWHSRDGAAKGYWALSSLGAEPVIVSAGGGYELAAGFGQYNNQHYVYQSKSSQGEPTRNGANAFGFNEDAVWEWDVPVKAGSALTITAYIRYNAAYGGSATKPKLTLSGKGISSASVSATGAAQDAWELLTINAGTPSQDAALKLKAEGFSTAPGAKFYIDDIVVNQ